MESTPRPLMTPPSLPDIPADHVCMKRLGPWAMNNWPPGTPLPSKEDIDEAERRMHEEANTSYANGYQGDWGFGLSFTMATYARFTWWHLFEKRATK